MRHSAFSPQKLALGTLEERLETVLKPLWWKMEKKKTTTEQIDLSRLGLITAVYRKSWLEYELKFEKP